MRTWLHAVAAVTAVLACALVTALAPVAATADAKVMPGSFAGYALDACDAPSQRTMDRWRTGSKYWGIGIYIAGMNRGCDAQPNLTPSWVAEQSRKGWHLLPLVVGRQASCSPKGHYK